MNIIIYTKTGCPWCRDVMSLLNEKKVAYEEREVRANAGYYQELVTKSGQNKTPTLDIDGEILADSDKEQVVEFMKKKNIPGF